MAEPPVVVYMQRYGLPQPGRLDTPGDWRADWSWPPPGCDDRVLHLGAGGCLVEASDAADTSASGYDSFEYMPNVGTAAGLWSGGVPFGLAGDQRSDEAFSLVYTSIPLAEELHILGWPRAILQVSSSASVMGFVTSLSDVAPDGASVLVAKGMLNATRRNSLREPKPLTPGEVYRLDIQIDCTAWVFAPGHRIRLSIASADWPNVWPTPYAGSNRVYWGGSRASRLVLPAVPMEGSAPAPSFHASPRSVAQPSTAVDPPAWRVVQDQLTGRTKVEIENGARWRVGQTAVIERESTSSFDVDPASPSDASARGKHVYRIVRPNQATEALSSVSVQATATHFHLTIDLTVGVNGGLHFSKHWAESVPRQLL
jgi:hypothetical protein